MRYVLGPLFLGILALNVYRACTQSLTVDEAFTYNSFIAPPLGEAFAYYDANNHVLNTLLCRVVVKLFGPSEVVLRLPSLLGGALYLFTVLGLSEWMFGASIQAIISFVVLATNPIVLDYLSAARGYSLGLGLEFLAIWVIAKSLSSNPIESRRRWNITVGIALALSSTGNLVFVIPNAVLIVVFVCLSTISIPKPPFRSVALNFVEIVVPGQAVFALLMYLPLTHASASNFYLGEQSFSRSAEIFLVRSFNHPSVFWGHCFQGPIRMMTGPAILLALSLLSLVAGMGRRPWPEKQWPTVLVVPLTFVGSVGTVVILHLLIGFPFPYERTGLYFIPLATLTVLEAAAYGIRVRAFRIPAMLLYLYVCCVIGQYLLELKVDRYEEWVFDAGTKRVLNLLASMNKPVASQKRLAVSWAFDQSVNYYRETLGLGWLAPVDRTDPHLAGFDYYYVKPEDRPVVDALKLNVLYADPVSHALLASPSR